MKNRKPSRLLLHAPNVHQGGGKTLLLSVLDKWAPALAVAQLDHRLCHEVHLPAAVRVHYVQSTLGSRLQAEWRLWHATRNGDVVLCFASLPPLLPLKSEVKIFVQNRLLVDETNLRAFDLRVAIRIFAERCLLRLRRSSRFAYIVQSSSMADLLRKRLHHKTNISIIPFAPEKQSIEPHCQPRNFDFIYVASGEPHKNHEVLIQAWCILAKKGIRPSLALTLAPNTKVKSATSLAVSNSSHGPNITFLGELDSAEVDALYRGAKALVYPSLSESFGLPLLEASERGVPIVASELDYVRDVVRPVETFDPNSPISIARAICRFLQRPEPPVYTRSPDEFMQEVMKS